MFITWWCRAVQVVLLIAWIYTAFLNCQWILVEYSKVEDRKAKNPLLMYSTWNLPVERDLQRVSIFCWLLLIYVMLFVEHYLEIQRISDRILQRSLWVYFWAKMKPIQVLSDQKFWSHDFGKQQYSLFLWFEAILSFEVTQDLSAFIDAHAHLRLFSPRPSHLTRALYISSGDQSFWLGRHGFNSCQPRRTKRAFVALPRAV